MCMMLAYSVTSIFAVQIGHNVKVRTEGIGRAYQLPERIVRARA